MILWPGPGIPYSFEVNRLGVGIFCYSRKVEPYETYPRHGFESLVGFDVSITSSVLLALREQVMDLRSRQRLDLVADGDIYSYIPKKTGATNRYEGELQV